MSALVSVIVPAYHIADYIEKCVQSIMGQTYRHIEIILVDDGSFEDETGNLCDMLASQDSRIKVLHKENGGLVSARKAGLAVASGEYILNVDGDDWIEDSMIENLLQIAVEEDADIVSSGMYNDEGERQSIFLDTLPKGIYSSRDSIAQRIHFFSHFILNECTDRMGIRPSLCSKLIRRTLIEQVLPALSDDTVWAEDAAVTYSCCVRANRIVITHDVYYHYVKRGASITNTIQKYFLRSLNEAYVCMKLHAKSSPFYEQIKKQMDMFLVRDLLYFLPSHGELGKDAFPPVYCFRNGQIPVGSRIALYGAGNVGQAYFRQIKAESQYNIVAWVDRAWEKCRNNGLSVVPIDVVASAAYDYIVVAVADKFKADEIREQLIKERGICREKIVWTEPGIFLDRYLWN